MAALCDSRQCTDISPSSRDAWGAPINAFFSEGLMEEPGVRPSLGVGNAFGLLGKQLSPLCLGGHTHRVSFDLVENSRWTQACPCPHGSVHDAVDTSFPHHNSWLTCVSPRRLHHGSHPQPCHPALLVPRQPRPRGQSDGHRRVSNGTEDGSSGALPERACVPSVSSLGQGPGDGCVDGTVVGGQRSRGAVSGWWGGPPSPWKPLLMLLGPTWTCRPPWLHMAPQQP